MTVDESGGGVEGRFERPVPGRAAEHELGADGSALVHDVLILGMTMEQVGQRRGLRTQRWQDYFARRLKECLDRLVLMYGLATPNKVPVKDRQC